MGAQSHISWTDATWNPWRGCRKVSAGCANCYAEKLVNRFGGDFSKRVRAAAATFNAPLRWNKQGTVCDDCSEPILQRPDSIDCKCGQAGAIGKMHRRRVFSLSLGDWLDWEVPTQWRVDMLDIIDRCQDLDFLLLTKRPEAWEARMMECAGLSRMASKWWRGEVPPNVWLGVTVENQEQADRRVPELLKIPAKVRFLSVEPLLGPVDLLAVKTGDGDGPSNELIWIGEGAGIDWVIIGGESGPNRRDCGVDAIVSVANQCRDAGVPVFVKQDCAFKPGQQGRIPDPIWQLKQHPQ